jgi:ATP-dependent DNA helicase 2 subunit 2
MADKQATVYIVDQGRSMGEKHGGRNESNLEYGMRYVWDKITTTLLASRATWTVGVIGLRTDKTNNPLEGDEGYDHISIMQPLGAMKMPQLNLLQDSIKVNKTDMGDAISAIIIAIEMIMKFTRNAKGEPLKYARKIVLMTDGRGPMDGDDLGEVSKKLNEDGIELVVVGVDFDDAEFGFKEEDKDFVKSGNEALLKTLTDQCEKSAFGTAAEAIEDTSIPRVKQTRPYKTYTGQLSLGDPEKYMTALCIDVERYFRTHRATAPTASSYVLQSDVANGESIVEDYDLPDGEGGLAAVRNARTYKVDDESAPGGKRDVDRDELARGYEYGRTAVHIAESDENVTKLETTQSFTIIGFIPYEKVIPS